MAITEIIEVITNQGLAIGLVSLTVVGLYKGFVAVWQHYKERIAVNDEKEKRQEEREERTNQALFYATNTNEELVKTNQLLATKFVEDLGDLRQEMNNVNHKLDFIISSNKNEKE